MENGCSVGNASRKGLSDITNLQQQPKVLTQGEKLLLQPASLRSKDYIDKLQQVYFKLQSTHFSFLRFSPFDSFCVPLAY